MQELRYKIKLLTNVMAGTRSATASPSLAQLLLRLDFNGYFTLRSGRG